MHDSTQASYSHIPLCTILIPRIELQSKLLHFALHVSGIQPYPAAGTSQACAYEIAQVPFIFKYAVDGLAASPTGDPLMSTSVLAMTPIALLIGYGVARVTAVGCNELRNAVFAKVRTCSLVRAMAFHFQEKYGNAVSWAFHVGNLNDGEDCTTLSPGILRMIQTC